MRRRAARTNTYALGEYPHKTGQLERTALAYAETLDGIELVVRKTRDVLVKHNI